MTCYICGSEKYVDRHHYDCQEGKLSPETVPLCRRCHRTYHDRGIEWFDDEYLDRAIEVENKQREIYNANLEYFEKERAARAAQFPWNTILKKPITPLPPMQRADVRRSDYWNKTHGIKNPGIKKPEAAGKGLRTFHLPNGEPLCGRQWVREHLDDSAPPSELVIYSEGKEVARVNSVKRGEVRKILKEA